MRRFLRWLADLAGRAPVGEPDMYAGLDRIRRRSGDAHMSAYLAAAKAQIEKDILAGYYDVPDREGQ